MTQPHRNRYRYLILGSIVLVGGILSTIAALMVGKWQIQQQHLNKYLQMTEALGLFYETSEGMTRQDFQDFSHAWRQTSPGIVEFALVPRFSPSEIGLDEGSAQALRLTLEQARDSGKMAASSRLNLAPDKTAFALYRPLYRRGSFPNSQPERRQAFVGAILTLYQLQELAKVVIPPPISLEQTWLALAVFLAGLGLTGWLSRTVWQMLVQQKRIEKLVVERTAELHQARASLGDRIQQLTAELEAVNQAKQDWLSHLGHELRTPLNIMAGFTQLLNGDRSLTPQQREILLPILRSSDHLLVLLDNLLEMAKLEARTTSLVPIVFNLPTFIKNLVEMLHLKASTKGVQVNTYLAPEVPQYISADENKLRQVLLNLLDNALKYTDEGSISLRLENSDRCWTLDNESEDSAPMLFFEVEDTGMGMTSALVQRVFEPFVRGDSAQPGTGLGLYLTRRLVLLMGGSIQVSSQLGAGTLFQLRIPVKTPELDAIPAFSSQQRVIGLAPDQPEYRILIVDDQADNRLLLTKILAPLGFYLREAANGEEAIEIWASWRPQLILMDTRMPQMDGYRTVEQIKARSQQQRTIMIALTAGNLEVSRQNVLAEFDAVLRKPFPIERLLETIATYLGVRFRYESREVISESEAIAESSSLILQSAAFRVMPPAWIAQVHQAACAGHGRATAQLIQEIPVQHEALALALTTLVHHFQFRQIRDLTYPQKP